LRRTDEALLALREKKFKYRRGFDVGWFCVGVGLDKGARGARGERGGEEGAEVETIKVI
jgi:hypothetical protein